MASLSARQADGNERLAARLELVAETKLEQRLDLAVGDGPRIEEGVVKARQVKGLKPDGWLAENARRIVLVRLDELLSFGEASRDPERVTELHDMRIAAKRLRYVLEIHEPLFGFTAGRAARTVRDLQDLLGQIHDCDEMIPMVRRHARSLRREDVEAMRAAAEPGSR